MIQIPIVCDKVELAYAWTGLLSRGAVYLIDEPYFNLSLNPSRDAWHTRVENRKDRSMLIAAIMN